MNNKVWLAILTGSLLLYPVAAFSATEDAVTSDAVVESVQAPEQTLSGKIVLVNLEESYVIVEYSLEEDNTITETAVFYFLPTLKIMQNGGEIVVSDLKEGDSVSVSYGTDENNSKVISTLTIK